MIYSILANSICLAMMDYTDDENQTSRNIILLWVDDVFTIIYTTEACLKILAFGLVIHRKSYLKKSNWNVFDFIIVVIGLI